MKETWGTIFAWTVCFCLLVAYQLAVTEPQLKHVGALKLQWQDAPHCAVYPLQEAAKNDICRGSN